MKTSRGKVLLAMSGGVDSSVAALLLLRAGYEVVGVFMRLGSPGEDLDRLIPGEAEAETCDPRRVRIGHRGCCSINDAADARLVAAELGIPFYVCNFKREFNRIIDYFVREYAQGRTPNPCVRCNDWLKFGRLHTYAEGIGADFVASGHYARVVHDAGAGARLCRAVDHQKDQSYVLFGVPRDRLSRMLLPIGDLEKPKVRQMAHEAGLPVFDKPDSQEICFVPDDDYAALVERRLPQLSIEGEFRDVEGKRLGAHGGQHRFTIGQRRGLGIALGRPVYVVDRDPESNVVTLGAEEDLLARGCTVAEANWLIDPPRDSAWRPCRVRYRAHGEAVAARWRAGPDLEAPTPSGRSGSFEVEFERPQSAVAPGQALVLDDAETGETVLGGGWIIRAQGAD